jgi:two-component system, chemotaxis family, CheB/CheR fusion protein
MGRAQNLLIERPEQAVSLRALLWLELDAKGMQEGTRFVLEGEDVLCSPRTIQVLALVLHELATNAVKYGALSGNATPAARVTISWTVEPTRDEECLTLRWRETGVDMKPMTPRRGFGSEMIDNLVPQMLGGSTRLQRHADGIECVIRFPLVEQHGLSRGLRRRPA